MIKWDPQQNIELDYQGDKKEEEKKEASVGKKNIWNKKLSRYLAWIVDEGVLQSKFTIREIVNRMRDS